MNENLLGGQENAELAHLQGMSGQENAELAQPQSVEDLTDEGFLEYLNRVSNGEEPIQKAMEAEKPSETEKNEPFKTFETQEEYQRDFDEHFNKRFKNHKQNEEGLANILNAAREAYGEADDKTLLERVKSDVLGAAASKNGKTPEDMESEMELKRKAAAYDKIEKAEQERNTIIDTWIRDAERLKETDKDFDLETALQNEEFRKSLVEKNRSVAESYAAAFIGSKKAVPSRAISQNASMNTSSSSVRKDPSQMTDEEFQRYINKIKGI